MKRILLAPEEQDALSGWWHVLRRRTGERKQAKRMYRTRFRQVEKRLACAINLNQERSGDYRPLEHRAR